MPLASLPLPFEPVPLPSDVRRLLREAERRIARLNRRHHFPAFVASDFTRVYSALSLVEARDLPPGRWFCEWGSGLGVVACLAAMLGFDAWGIEAEGELVDAARRFAEDFDLTVEFCHGSFVPAQMELPPPQLGEFAWLHREEPSGYDDIGLEVDDFDLIYAYPWPDEESLTTRIFEQHAREGALLLTYHSNDEMRLQRQGRPRRRA